MAIPWGALSAIDFYSFILIYVPILLVVYSFVWAVYALTFHPLSSIPGPLWACVSRTWLMYHHGIGDVDIVTQELHKRYGPIVRIAPEQVTVADPSALPLIFPVQKPLQKTDWYIPWRPKGLGSQPDLFTQTDEKAHNAYRKIVGGVYSMSSILRSEAGLNGMLELFMERLGGFADRGEAFDFGLWLEMYSFDNIGVAFFGQEFGFLRDSVDYNGYIHAVHLAMPFLSILTVTPYYAQPLLILVAVCIPKLLRAVLAVEDIKKSAIKETKKATERSLEMTGKRPDVISQLLSIVREKGEKVNYSHREITSDMWVGIMAGADSTSVNMRSIFYFLMKNPEKLEKVRAEVDAAFEDGTLSSPVQYSRVSTLPYLTAVIKEAGRLFPAFAVSMPRYAPSQGLTLCGKYIPGEYTVGMNPAILQHDSGVFGENANEFEPERWLQSEERTRAMDRAILAFGAGTRTCVGKPVGGSRFDYRALTDSAQLALTQLYKVTAEILRRFTFEMAHDRPWKVQNCAFNVQTDVVCRFQRRKLTAT